MTLQTGAGNQAFGAGCSATISGYSYPGDGTTVDVVSSQDSIDVYDYPITDTSGPSNASATDDDPLSASDLATGPTTVLDVLANDTGSELRVVAISAVTQVSGDCGTIAITGGGLNITYTAEANGNAECTFTYDVQAHDGFPTTFGPTDQGFVRVNQSAVTDTIVAAIARFNAGGAGASLDITEDFTGATDAAIAVFSQGWTQGGTDSTNCFRTDTGATASGGTGLTSGNPQPYVYNESSTAGGTNCVNLSNGDQFWLESPDIDATLYTSSLTMSFDYNYESNDTGNWSIVEVRYRNGSGGTWTPLQTIFDGTGPLHNPSGAWASTGNIDLSGVLDQAQSRVRIRVTNQGGTVSHDVAFDNINLTGTGAASSDTLDVLAVNTAGALAQVDVDYSAASAEDTLNLSHVSGNQHSVTGGTLGGSGYHAQAKVYSDYDATGLTINVANGGPALAWDVVTVTSAEWDGTDMVVTATNTWDNGAQLYADYNGSGPVAMTWGGASWSHTFSSVAYAATVDVTSNAAGTNDTGYAVTDLTAVSPVILNGVWDIITDTTDGGTISNAYTAPAGDDRVLIVIVMTDDEGGLRTVTGATFNGSAVTEITSQSSGNNDVWIGYQALGAGSGASIADTVQATFSANTRASRIAVATYDNANQTQATNSNQTAATDNTPSITFNNAANGRAVYGVLFNNTSTITPPNGGTGWTEYDDTTVSVTTGWPDFATVSFRMGVGERDTTTAATPETVDPVSAGASNPSILVGVSIDPL
jgi:hypothetical protein